MVRTRERNTIADDDVNIHRGSGDFLADQGKRGLTQAQAAAITVPKQSDVSRIVTVVSTDMIPVTAGAR